MISVTLFDNKNGYALDRLTGVVNSVQRFPVTAGNAGLRILERESYNISWEEVRTLTSTSTRQRGRSRIVSLLAVLLMSLAGVISVASPAQAATVLLNGSSWLGGNGVNVCAPSTDTTCGGETHVGGWSANWWQCVELAQRLYQERGWHSGIFSGVDYAYQIYDRSTATGGLGMTRQANGSITSVRPGDMIVHGSNEPYSGGAGHVSIVNDVDGTTVNVVEQNTYNNDPTGSYTLTNGTLTRSGSGTIRGVVHDPQNTSAGSGGGWGGVGTATYFGSHTLTTGQILANNQYLMSDDGRFVLKMQTDGNLVAYGPGGWYWESNTAGYSNAYLKVQTDGNVVLYGSGAARWATGKKGITAFKLQTDGNVVGRNSGGTPVWETNTVRPGTFTYKGSDTLTTSQTLTASNNQFLRSSDKSHFAVMQSDGNFVLYGPGYVTYWDSNTNGHPGAYLKVQTDGNVVIYTSSDVAIWETETTSVTAFKIQTDGNLVGRNSGGTPVWATDTVN